MDTDLHDNTKVYYFILHIYLYGARTKSQRTQFQRIKSQRTKSQPDKIPTDKIPNTGLSWFIHACMVRSHGSCIHTYYHHVWCTLHYYAVLVYFAFYWNTNSNKTNTCKTVLTPSEYCHPGSTFSHLMHCALSLGATHTLLILMLLMFPLNLDGSNYR